MLNKQAIYHKTPKGTAAIANRQSGLAPKLRPLLIMVDGKRSFAELSVLSGDCENLLAQLAQDGLIAPAGDALPVTAAPEADASAMAATMPAPLEAVRPAPAPAPLPLASLPEAKRFTSRLLVDLLGPSAEVLCMKIEAAGNLADFVSAVKRARDIVRDIKGASVAANFIAQVELRTPQT